MTNQVKDSIDYTLMALGTAIGVRDIESVLGIIILSVQIILAIWKVGVKVHEHWKARQLDEITKDVEELTTTLEDMKGGIDNGKGDD